MRRSANSRLKSNSLFPVPLNSSKITWSIFEPVSTKAVATILSEPPPLAVLILRALPRKRFGFSMDVASSPPDRVRPLPSSTVLYARANLVMESKMITTSSPISTRRLARCTHISATATCRDGG